MAEGTRILKCSFSTALEALTDAVGDNTKRNEWKSNQCRYYEFGWNSTLSIFRTILQAKMRHRHPAKKCLSTISS